MKKSQLNYKKSRCTTTLFFILSLSSYSPLYSSDSPQAKTSSPQSSGWWSTTQQSEPERDAPTDVAPYSETRYALWRTAGKTDTSYFCERYNDGSLAATLTSDPVRAQTLFTRSVEERMKKPNQLDTITPEIVEAIDNNQKKLQTILEISKIFSEDHSQGAKLELDASLAERYRKQQEKVLLSYITTYKKSICTEKETLVKTALEKNLAQIQTAESQAKSIFEAIETERKIYTEKWKAQELQAQETIEKALKESTEEKANVERLAQEAYDNQIDELRRKVSVLAFNYSRFKQRANYRADMPYKANSKSHYKNFESFKALFEEIAIPDNK